MNTDELLMDSFGRVFDHIDKFGIKKGVDEKGLDRFIEECADLSALTGVAAGLGGIITLLPGLPVELINNIVQQFRVTLAVIYDRRGTYEIPFDSFMAIVGMSVGVEAGLTVTKAALLEIAAAIVGELTPEIGLAAVPLLGGIIDGGINYAFIKSIGKSVKALKL